MDNRKIYLLAELTVLPEFLDEVKAVLEEALKPTLQEPGCEALFETSREDDPHKLIFFEIFSSPEAHKFHLEQDQSRSGGRPHGILIGFSPLTSRRLVARERSTF